MPRRVSTVAAVFWRSVTRLVGRPALEGPPSGGQVARAVPPIPGARVPPAAVSPTQRRSR